MTEGKGSSSETSILLISLIKYGTQEYVQTKWNVG
jgi:hypothetical protein